MHTSFLRYSLYLGWDLSVISFERANNVYWTDQINEIN